MVAKIQLGARVILGLIYMLSGAVGLGLVFGIIPMPSNHAMPQAVQDFMNGIMGTGYFFPLLKGTETLGGLMLVSGIAAPLGLVVLAPITLNIFLFHWFLTPGLNNSILPITMVVLHVVAMSGYWAKYQGLFRKG